VVLSLLWLVVFPICLLVDTNQRTNDYYKECVRMAGVIASNLREGGQNDRALAEEQGAHDKCWKLAGHIPLDRLVRTLLVGNPEGASLWAALLAPIAFFWLLGGAVFSTVRLIRCGFTRCQ
jgi:hypothetical protein